MRITIYDYLIRVDYWIYRVKGIDAERISEKGYGETAKSKLDDCTEEEHALNRRSEFMITK
jgi:outer membrane protein OmpA-like peptidoglycan-associated protein